jgi:predicted amidophosphoribosyltransferase
MFCWHCGEALHPPQFTSCLKCGFSMPSNMKFCWKCGSPLVVEG